ncbi:MAG: hypothetical protein WBP45_06165 [Daejeonella sp.]
MSKRSALIKLFFLNLPLAILIISCSKGPQKETEVYKNDFENNDLLNFTNAKITAYNNSQVLGRYNSEGFTAQVGNLPKHDLLRITFDLYIHDSWDGNQEAIGGPDIWEFKADGNTYISTTFSNTPCAPGTFCPPQSYPANYLNNNNFPLAGAYRTDLPGACSLSGNPGGTIQYKIEKIIRHSANQLTIHCFDKLVQTNTADPLCDESWSIDNLQVKAIQLN